jgi:hypothetical protein
MQGESAQTAITARLAEAAGCRFYVRTQIDIHRFYTAGRRLHRARTKDFFARLPNDSRQFSGGRRVLEKEYFFGLTRRPGRVLSASPSE